MFIKCPGLKELKKLHKAVFPATTTLQKLMSEGNSGASRFVLAVYLKLRVPPILRNKQENGSNKKTRAKQITQAAIRVSSSETAGNKKEVTSESG